MAPMKTLVACCVLALVATALATEYVPISHVLRFVEVGGCSD